MSTARSTAEEAPAADVAAALHEVPFVRVVASADGDSLAASGILAAACRSVRTPFHVRTTAALAADDGRAADDGLAVAVGLTGGDVALAGASRPASVTAFEVARELGVEPDPILGLAGVVAAESTVGADGSGTMLDAAERRGTVERRPGLAVPTADVSDGIAHSTLVHTPSSGEVERVRAMLAEMDLPAELGEEAHRRLASVVAIDATTADEATARAAEAVERALRPYAIPDGTFETVGGYADVLDAVAREQPGTGVALALGHGDVARAAALDAWRAHAVAAHRLLREATTGRYDGVFVARVDADAESATALPTVARLLRDFRSPEPVALVVTDTASDDAEGRAAAASIEDRDLGTVMTETAASFDGTGRGTDTRGEARFDTETDTTEFITAVREALTR
ncbi:hypothetical protein SAMN04487948_10221 [Halogranum amylolyticum]|uniref:Exonuclease RecJ n=1 Tax=Halogranum amylolyticum TaxID=660520 RepID=A0A1H8P0D6_9EURY|nr:exonuclease RecJ [Halogranum amylolyticum]SEO35349.1 hypothetical protein SAMN04487948_10221 [Halogranum amylolyticum]